MYLNYTSIDTIYDKIIKDNKKIITIIKNRQDTTFMNPRYNFSTKDNYLLLKYHNTDLQYDQNKNLVEKIDQKFNKKSVNIDYEYYYFGKFDKHFSKDITNKKMAEDSKDLIFDKLIKKKEDVCIIGYGQSGSGKTSSLIYLQYMKNNILESQDGILIELCKTKEFINEYSKIKLIIQNIYIDLDKKPVPEKIFDIKDNYYKQKLLTNDSNDYIFEYINNEWINNNNKNLGAVINQKFTEREIDPTPNNPESSRSHIVLCLELEYKNKQNNNNESRKLIVCDLAGVENRFNCENSLEIYKFDDKYIENYKKYKDPKTFNKYQKEYIDDIFIYFNKINNTLKTLNINSFNNNIIYNYFNNYDESIREEIYPQSYNYEKIKLKKEKEKNLIDSIVNTNGLEKFNGEYKIFIKKYEKIIINNINEKNNYNNSFKNANNLTTYSFIGNKTKKTVIDNYEELKDNCQYIAGNNGIYTYKCDIKFHNKFGIFFTTNTEEIENENNKRLNNFKNVYRTLLNLLFKLNPIIFNNQEPNGLISEDTFNNIKKYIYGNEFFSLLQTNLYNLVIWTRKKFRYDVFVKECYIRRKEGYMINKSLYDLKLDVALLLKKSLQRIDKPMPIFYDNNIFPFCRNNNLEDNDNLEKFYDMDSDKTLSGVIIKTMNNDMKVKTDKLNFVLFTVYNTTHNGLVNNPPNPPYININDLYYNTRIKKDTSLIRKSLTNILDTINKYFFYNDFKSNQIYITCDKIKDKDDSTINNNIKSINDLIDFISVNNASTLIGSLETTDMLQNIIYDKYVCSNIPNNINTYLNINDKLKTNTKIKFKLKQSINSTSINNQIDFSNIDDYNKTIL